MKGEIKKLRRT